ncbi:MAG: YMGG-like glycine zipper-containing protein, partial [Pirellula sp.]|nr:YMGG-like glycine zipper-containing protein [Pirellula sp.]
MSFSHRIGLASIAISMLAMHFEARAQENTRNGALLGGAAGAVIGGIIGNNKNDQTAEGALIGGAVGAVT